MSWFFVGGGTSAQVIGSSTATPVLNPSTQSGDLIIFIAHDRNPANTLNAPTSGYTQLYLPVTFMGVWAKYAGASEANPSLTTVGTTYAEVATIRWIGSVVPSLGSIVHASNYQADSAVQVIPYPTLTVTNPNCFCIGFGAYQMLSTTINASVNFPNRIDYLSSSTGAQFSNIFDYVIQQTPTTLSLENVTVNGAAGNQLTWGLTLALNAGVGSVDTLLGQFWA